MKKVAYRVIPLKNHTIIRGVQVHYRVIESLNQHSKRMVKGSDLTTEGIVEMTNQQFGIRVGVLTNVHVLTKGGVKGTLQEVVGYEVVVDYIDEDAVPTFDVTLTVLV